MTFKAFILIIMGNVLLNNCVLQRFMGFPIAGTQLKCAKRQAIVGIALMAAVLVSAVICSIVNSVLAPAGLDYMSGFLAVVVTALVAWPVSMVLDKVQPDFAEITGSSYPVVALNTAVLGITVQYMAATVAEAAAAAIGAGLALILASYLFAGVRERVCKDNVPAAFRGLPCDLISASIIAMSLMAFSGVFEKILG